MKKILFLVILSGCIKNSVDQTALRCTIGQIAVSYMNPTISKQVSSGQSYYYILGKSDDAHYFSISILTDLLKTGSYSAGISGSIYASDTLFGYSTDFTIRIIRYTEGKNLYALFSGTLLGKYGTLYPIKNGEVFIND